MPLHRNIGDFNWATVSKVVAKYIEVRPEGVRNRMTCRTQGCQHELATYRSCAIKGCPLEFGYCIPCGGDNRSMDEMQKHIAQHTKKELAVKVGDDEP